MKWDKSDIGKEYHKKYNKKYRGTHKKYFRLSQKKYYLTHRDYYKIKSIEHYNKFRFGGLRGLVLERDGYKCLHCGMTDVEHRKIWGRNEMEPMLFLQRTGRELLYLFFLFRQRRELLLIVGKCGIDKLIVKC